MTFTFIIELQLSPVVMRNKVRKALPNVLKLVCLLIPVHSPSRLSQAYKSKEFCFLVKQQQRKEEARRSKRVLLSLPNISTPRVANMKKNSPNRSARFPTWSNESPTVFRSDCIPLADLRSLRTRAILMMRMTLMRVGSTGNWSMSTNLLMNMDTTDTMTMNKSNKFQESLTYCLRPRTYTRNIASIRKISVNA